MSAELTTIAPLIPYDPATGDIHMLRHIIWGGDPLERIGVQAATNIRQELWLWPEVGLGWGRDGPEGVTLALAILHRMIPGELGHICDEWHRPLACSTWAYRLSFRCYLDLLEPIPFWGGRLAGHEVRRWIYAEMVAWQQPTVDLGRITPAEAFPE